MRSQNLREEIKVPLYAKGSHKSLSQLIHKANVIQLALKQFYDEINAS